MTVRMTNQTKKVLLFPKPPAKAERSRIVVQIGSERFAIHYEVEDLPPVPPLLPWKRPSKKATPRTVFIVSRSAPIIPAQKRTRLRTSSCRMDSNHSLSTNSKFSLAKRLEKQRTRPWRRVVIDSFSAATTNMELKLRACGSALASFDVCCP